MTRFPDIPPDRMTPEQKKAYDEIASGPRGGVRGPFPALMHNPELARRVQVLGEHLRYKSKLPAALNELAILVTARRWMAQYEWYAHAKLAKAAGLAEGIIDAIAEGRAPNGMTTDETLVYTFAHTLLAEGEPGDRLFGEARERFGYDGVLDMIALCGYYTIVALILNTAQVPVPGGDQPLKPINP